MPHLIHPQNKTLDDRNYEAENLHRTANGLDFKEDPYSLHIRNLRNSSRSKSTNREDSYRLGTDYATD
ncbi:MAG: hypothetical protein Q7S74_00875 [Nanoarchaeota archaeon]|nr:hypothetical protein [Nanoarchaeota archaeon]